MLHLSIITINYNNLLGLKKTVNSVISQTYSDFEFIVIDGGSTDGSREFIEDFSKKFSYSVSENDNGIYHAMNKGIAKASGKYLLFLNSGDFLIRTTVLKEIFQFEHNEDILYCNVRNSITNDEIIFPAVLTFSYFYYATINHQSTFIKSNLFQKLGFYNENYKIVSDWEFFLKAIFLNHCSTKYVNIACTVFDYSQGISTDIINSQLLQFERSTVLNTYFSKFLIDYKNSEIINDLYKTRLNESIRFNPLIVKYIRKLKNKFFD